MRERLESLKKQKSEDLRRGSQMQKSPNAAEEEKNLSELVSGRVGITEQPKDSNMPKVIMDQRNWADQVAHQ